MSEAPVRDCLISHFHDVTIQRLVGDKGIDDSDWSVPAASHYALRWANERPQAKVNVESVNLSGI